MPEQDKVRENSGEGSFRYRRASRSVYLGMEANDSTNHIITGFLRFRSGLLDVNSFIR